MEELKDDYQTEDLEHFIIEDNEYRRKRRIKLFAIIFPIILAIIAITLVIVFLLIFVGGTLTCTYVTTKDDEQVKLLNDKIFEKYTLKITFGEESIDDNNLYTFSKAGKHKITFDFKEKIESLENFFEGLDKLYEVDLSQLIFEENKITSVSKMFKNCINLKKINIKINIDTKIENAEEMCYNCKSLENIDFLNDIDTTHILNISSIFAECSSLNIEKIAIKTSKVKDLSKMFYNCINLTSINNLDLKTSEVTDFSSMFEGCEKLTYVNLLNLDTSKATNFQNFFSGCISLTSFDLSNFKTENVIDMSCFFDNCQSLENIDLSKLVTNNVKDMSGMFSNCNKIKTLDLSKLNTANVEEMEELFLNCNSLENIIFGNDFVLNKVEDMSYMFANCENLTEIKLGKDNKNLFENLRSIQNIFYGCTNLKKVDFNEDKTNYRTFSKLSDLSGAFADCINLEEFIISNVNTECNLTMENTFINCHSLQNIDFSPFFNLKESTLVSNMFQTFKNCSNLTSVNFSLLDLSEAFDFTESFSGCTSLISINFSSQSFTKAYYMDKMFYGCINLENIQLPFSMGMLIHAKNLFEGCKSLKSIDLSGFQNSHSLMDISGMFKNCTSLEEVKFEHLEIKTKYLINMDEMFYGCINLKRVNFLYFNTDRIKSIERMFYDCTSLNFLNITSFEIPYKDINYKDVFEGVPKKHVKVIYIKGNLFDELETEIESISINNNTNNTN